MIFMGENSIQSEAIKIYSSLFSGRCPDNLVKLYAESNAILFDSWHFSPGEILAASNSIRKTKCLSEYLWISTKNNRSVTAKIIAIKVQIIVHLCEVSGTPNWATPSKGAISQLCFVTWESIIKPFKILQAQLEVLRNV